MGIPGADGPSAAVAILQRAVDDGTTSGFALSAGRGDEVELPATAGGWAQITPRRRAMHAGTLFDVASLTKVMATLPVILRLIAAGALSLHTPAGDGLPGLAAPRITVRQLLTHTAGFPPEPTRTAPDPAELRARIIATPLIAEPGTTVAYSDVGFLVLGWLAETVTGRPLDALLATEVTEPLRLTRTRYGPLAPWQGDVATTEPRADGAPVTGTVHDETAAALQAPAGHAGVFSDAADLGAYLAAWADPGEAWLPAELRAQATRDHTAAAGGHRGLGWTARHDRSDQLGDRWPPTAVFHSGFTGTSLALDPVSGRWVVMLTNDVHLGRGRGTINPLRNAVHTALAP